MLRFIFVFFSKKTKLYIEFFLFSCYTLYKKWTVLSRSKESILFRLCYFYKKIPVFTRFKEQKPVNGKVYFPLNPCGIL